MGIIIISFPIHGSQILKLTLAILSIRFSTSPTKSGKKFQHLKNKKNQKLTEIDTDPGVGL